jgi:hypothetical protein
VARVGRHRLCTLGLAVFVVLSKVLSPQYFVWMLPLLAVAGTEALESDRAHWWWCAGLVGVAALTTLDLPAILSRA